MGRLSVVVLFTPELARQQEFYEKSLGISAAVASPRWVQFATSDAVLALRVLAAGETPRIELGFDVPSLDERLAILKDRGVKLEGRIEESADCRIARVRDPEGNMLQLVERRKPTVAGRWPRLSHGIVNAKAFEACARFYHDALGFKMAEEREHWIEFETGAARLTLHASRDADGLPLAPDQRVAFALMDDDLDVWADELRARGVRFATSPTEEEVGRMAEVEDVDGWFVVLRGPSPETPFEEALAEEYVDEDTPRGELMRKSETAEPGSRPAFGSRKLARKKVERVATKGFDAMQKARESERGSTAPGGGTGSRGDGPPRAFTPRPDGPRTFTPRPDRPAGTSGPRPFTPRPEGARPFTPRPDRPPGAPSARPGPPRSDSPRTFTPRPERASGASAPRPFTPRPEGTPRATPPHPDSPRSPGTRRDAGSPPSPPRSSGPPRGPRRDDR